MRVASTFLIITILFVLASCKKDEPPRCPSVLHAPQEFLDYWYFPQGSSWVYKLKGSEPAVYDTVRNTGRLRAFYAEPNQEAGLAAHCEMFYVHDLVHYNKNYFLGTNPHTNYLGGEGLRGWRTASKWVIDQSWSAIGYPTENIIFFYPFTIGQQNMVDDNWVSDTNAVVTPMGTFHKSVTTMRGYYTPDSSEYITRKVSFTQNVGITYRKFYNGKEWELVNFHINR